MCCPILVARTCGKAPIFDRNVFLHVAVVLPRKSDFTLKMLCMHHIIRTDVSIIVVVSIAGCSPQNTKTTKPPNLQLPQYLSYSTFYDSVKNIKKLIPSLWLSEFSDFS